MAKNDAKPKNSNKAEPKAPRVKDWRKVKAYAEQREALKAARLAAGYELDALTLDRIEQYLEFWCQKQMLAEDVRKRGPVVSDDRGRLSENRSISLGLQTSKQMLALYQVIVPEAYAPLTAADEGLDDDL